MAATREEICRQIGDLPTLPFIAAKLLDTLADDNASAVDVARILASDQAASARLLRLANSAAYSPSRPVATVRDAIVLIGFAAVRRIALGLAVLDNYTSGPPVSGLDYTRLWLHALATGAAARELAPRMRKDGEEAFMAGLLHDVGKVMLATGAPEEYSRAVGLSERMPLIEAEREVFGFDHGAVAGILLAEWQFPGSVIDAAAHHHEPLTECRQREYVLLVHAGNCLARQAQIGYSGDSAVPEVAPWVAERLALETLEPADFAARLATQTRDRWKALMPAQ